VEKGARGIKTTNISLREILESGRELILEKAIEGFSCINSDVEDFLKKSAIDFEKRHRSRTYLLLDADRAVSGESVIYGFYTVTFKNLELGETLSKTTIKNIDGFSGDVRATEAFLLGQLGKNRAYQDIIAGQDILDQALDTMHAIHRLVGGRIVCLECEEIPKLVEFYTRNGFIPLQKRGKYLQMIKYL
jgi:hypothetical protein